VESKGRKSLWMQIGVHVSAASLDNLETD
jgi:hypothetical protein